MSKTPVRLLAIVLGGVFALAPFVAEPAAAAPTLTISPITWDIVGLDSNSPATGPNRFPVGARVCAQGGGATDVTAVFAWDSANANIDLRPGSLSTVDLGPIASGACADAYFEAEIARNNSAYDTSRRYHITATDSGSGATVTSARPRQLYVEHLISQNRNGITSVALDGALIPAGGSMTLIQGRTYDITLSGYTATQGYNQLEAFIGLPNTVFQILSVATTFSANTSPYVATPNDRLYADACRWDADPNSPNYSSCIGGDYKSGGTVSTTYHVRIVGGAGTDEQLGSLLYDFSGSSFHYNADFGVGARVATILGPSSVPISKTFSPRVITPGGTSTLTFKVSNPTPDPLTGVAFTDTLPAGMAIAASPTTTITGCGAGAFSPAPGAGATSLSFANGTIAGNGTCTASVKVTAPAGTYNNTTGHLFIDDTVDTGNTAHDTLTAASAAACTPGQTLANWSVPNGTTANPPDLNGGVPTVKGSGVASAAATAGVPANSQILASTGHIDTTSWDTWGYKNAGQHVDFTIDTTKYSGVAMSYWVANPGGANGPNSLVLSYSTGGAFTPVQTITSPAAGFTQHTFDFSNLTSTTGSTVFRFTATGANNDQTGANLDFDDIAFTGCFAAPPAPTVTKTFAPKPIVKGATSTLTFSLANTAVGNVALTGVAFTDALPAGLSVASSSAAGCGGTVTTTAASRTIALTGGTLAAGGSCSFNVTVTGAAEGQYDNVTGFVSTTQGGTSTNYATDSLTVIAPPTIEKGFAPAGILVGGTSTLTLDAANPNGGTTLTGVGFSDTLPAGVTVASSGPTAKCGGSLTTTAPSTIALSGASLAPGARCTITVTVTGATAGTKVNTTGLVTSTEGGNGGTATATLVVSSPVASLDLNKQVSTDGATWRKVTGVPVGGSVFYRFALYNSGDVAFSTVSVSDPDVAGCTWSGAPNPALQPGDTAYCTTAVISAVSGLHTNTAAASGTSVLGQTTSAPSSATYGTFGLSLAKSATETSFAAPGNVLHYAYLVKNTGFASLLGPVSVADDKTSVTCPAVDTVGDNDPYLDPGESLACTATYSVLAGDVTTGHVTNTASATVDGVSSAPDHVTVPLAKLTLAKTSTTTAITAAGQVVPYTITATNAGDAVLTGLSVTDPTCDSAPALTSGDTGADGVFSPGEAWVFTCDRTVTQNDIDAGSPLSNTATGDTDQTAPVPATLDIPILAAPSLTLGKSAAETFFTAAGDQLHYSYLVTNTGSGTLAGPVTVTDDKTSVDCPVVASLAPGASVTCTATYTVTGADVTAKGVTNTATASAGGKTSPDVSVTVGLAAMSVVKNSDAGSMAAPGTIHYTITVTNTGSVDLTGLAVADPVPGGATYASGDVADTGVLNAGEAWVYTATRGVTQGDIDAGDSIVNTATVTSDQADQQQGTTVTTIDQQPGLAVSKTSATTQATHAGQTISYTLTVSNTGNTTLTAITVSDATCDAAPEYVSGDTGADELMGVGESWVYTCDRTVTQAEMDAGADLTNQVTADSAETGPAHDSLAIPVSQSPSLGLVKSITGGATFSAEGDVITYSYVVTNTGNVTIDGPITVADNKTTVDCPSVASLAPGESITCSSSYAVTADDLAAGSVTNTARASGHFGAEAIVRSATVDATATAAGSPTPTPTPTPTPRASATPAPSAPDSSTLDIRTAVAGSALGLLMLLGGGVAVFVLLAARPRRNSSRRGR